MPIRRHPGDTFFGILRRTVSAQLHFVGAIGALIAVLVLVRFTLLRPEPNYLWAVLLFGVSSLMVFGASTLYHFVCDGYQVSPGLRRWLKDIDHFAIYFFIAGSYTVFVLNALEKTWAYSLIAAIWTSAILGIVYTHLKPKLPPWARHRAFSTMVFVSMSWIVILRIRDLVQVLSPAAYACLWWGALCYVLGALIYITKRPKLFPYFFGFHELWHIMVILGYTFHYFVILDFYI